ncbi:MAG TPA: PaaI family thioesterase [Allosphingosinicella sp.]|jgi:acyl-coenzyme A thioesterase PaaI-like protein
MDASLRWHDEVVMNPLIRHAPDPDHPGWWTWDLAGEARYNSTIGKLLVRAEGPGRARCRMFPETLQSNLGDFVHGGAILTFIDMALFAGGRLAGISDISHSVTLDLSCQFIDAGHLQVPLDCPVELLRETGRLAFLRGTVEQDERIVAAWSGTLRKGGERR